MPMVETRTRDWLLAAADKARTEASRFHRAAIVINDPIVEETLLLRETELLKLADSFEEAAKLSPST